MRFANRYDAGRQLARALASYTGRDVVVVGLPSGGVPVAFEVSRALSAPLDVVVVRKLRVPFQPELAMGAVGETSAVVRNDDVVRATRITEQELSQIEQRERAEVQRLAERLRGDRPPIPLAGRIVVIVDDGIATGATARAACQVVRQQGADEIVLAAPVGHKGVEQQLGPDADIVTCLVTPRTFRAVGQFYDDFAQIRDEEVTALLRDAALPAANAEPGATTRPRHA